ncbi:MarR family winged helix-turn-helix transcriptional regulator [Lapidilactobacillus mulanensis]|uniref:MarR family winged helix-turn-helix transcriptional regulator n=1 Tax=Lapidilactobacillus mulanensis TaxID=2485999 RepID=A0ABW4DM02_9LACO|nr:MarR family transcriptional regulator [Lapidilactobacillus mulanensis]
MAGKINHTQSLGQMLIVLSQAITQNRSLAEFGLTRLQAMTLKKVYQNPGVSMSQLSTSTGIARAQLTRLISKLEESDLVQRQHNDTNRRMVNVYGTDKGHVVMTEHMQLIQDRIQTHVQTLSTTEQVELNTHLSESIRLMLKAGIINLDANTALFKK